MHVADRLQIAVEQTASIACVGLDPRPELLPPKLVEEALARYGDTDVAVGSAFTAFNIALLDAIAGHCAAVKPQLACYEAYGLPGWHALIETVRHARELGLEVIADGKRNDIGSTAAHYGQAFFGGAPRLGSGRTGGLGATWATANAYLGSQGIEPLLAHDQTHGIFVLVRTSNPSAVELQDQPSGEGTVADAMAALVHQWGRERRGRCGLSDIGAVVGATWPDQARRLRSLMPDTVFLVPGYGAQGGGAMDAVAGARPGDGGGLLVNSSRGIIGAWQATNSPQAWAEAARSALDAMNNDLSAARR